MKQKFDNINRYWHNVIKKQQIKYRLKKYINDNQLSSFEEFDDNGRIQ